MKDQQVQVCPLGLVEKTPEGREVVSFSDATGLPCSIGQGEITDGKTATKGVWINIGGDVNAGMLLNTIQVVNLARTLEHWVRQSKFSDYRPK